MKNRQHTLAAFTSIVFILAFAGSLLAFDGAAQNEKANPAAENASALKTQKERQSYALGSTVGSQLRNRSVEVDPDVFMQGLKDTLSGGQTLLTGEEVRAEVRDLQLDLRKKEIALRGEKLQEVQKNKQEGDAFLAENKAKEGVFTLTSGLQYKILKAGDGRKPTLDDTVVCHYRGTLIDGKEFDSSYRRNQPATFSVKRVIKGWSEALQLMPVGSRWQLFVPSGLAYGERGARSVIGPNATLVFEVELISIKGTTTDPRAPQSEVATNTEVGIVQQEADSTATPVAATLNDIKIAFKDPRLSDPTYGGERWISTPTFNSAAYGGTEATVEAKAVGIGANGRRTEASAKWTPADPETVTVTPGSRNVVKITVHRAGESKLTVASNGVSKELLIKAKYVGNATLVEITQ